MEVGEGEGREGVRVGERGGVKVVVRESMLWMLSETEV